MAELTAVATDSARTLEATQEQNASLNDQLGVAVIERMQLLVVATDRDRELIGKLVLRCGFFRNGRLYLMVDMLTHGRCYCSYLHGAALTIFGLLMPPG